MIAYYSDGYSDHYTNPGHQQVKKLLIKIIKKKLIVSFHITLT